MGFDQQHAVEDLDPEECWRLLAETTQGRLAVSMHNQPDIIPMEYRAHNTDVLLRIPQGETLVALTINPSVALEINGITDTSTWSVVLRGTARELQTWTEMDAARQKATHPWAETANGPYVEITPTEITGRRRAIAS